MESEEVCAIFEWSQIELDCCGHSDRGSSNVFGCKGSGGRYSEGGEDSLVVPLLHCPVFIPKDNIVSHDLSEALLVGVCFIERLFYAAAIVLEQPPVNHEFDFSRAQR